MPQWILILIGVLVVLAVLFMVLYVFSRRHSRSASSPRRTASSLAHSGEDGQDLPYADFSSMITDWNTYPRDHTKTIQDGFAQTRPRTNSVSDNFVRNYGGRSIDDVTRERHYPDQPDRNEQAN